MNFYKPTRKLENRMMEIARLRKRVRALEIALAEERKKNAQ
tara:strand:+ start:320 stop:442 length:123 start_codon:yes stop_codon:yes gene_type:complete